MARYSSPERQATFTLLNWVELQRHYHYRFHLQKCIWLCVCSCASSHWPIVVERRTWCLDLCREGRLQGYTGFPCKSHFHFDLPDLVLQHRPAVTAVTTAGAEDPEALDGQPEAHWVLASDASELSSVPSILPSCDYLYDSTASEHLGTGHRVPPHYYYHGKFYCHLACCDFAGDQMTSYFCLPQMRGTLHVMALTRGYFLDLLPLP